MTNHAPHQQIASLVDVAAHAFLWRKPREVALRDLAETLFLPGVDGDHEMAREALDQRARPEVVEALLLERRRQRPHAGFFVTHGNGADHGTEDQPVRRLAL